MSVSVCGLDTKEERNALMERVYPKLSEFCRDKYGLEFQVRSGVCDTDYCGVYCSNVSYVAQLFLHCVINAVYAGQ